MASANPLRLYILHGNLELFFFFLHLLLSESSRWEVLCYDLHMNFSIFVWTHDEANDLYHESAMQLSFRITSLQLKPQRIQVAFNRK